MYESELTENIILLEDYNDYLRMRKDIVKSKNNEWILDVDEQDQLPLSKVEILTRLNERLLQIGRKLKDVGICITSEIDLNDVHYFHYFFLNNFISSETKKPLTLNQKVEITQKFFIKQNLKMEFIKLNKEELEQAIITCSSYQPLIRDSKIINIDTQLCKVNDEEFTWLCFKTISFIDESKVDFSFKPIGSIKELEYDFIFKG